MLFSVVVLFSLTLSDDCRKEDVGISYGICDMKTRLRDLVFYWKRDCNVTSVRLPDPAVRQRVGCDFGCTNGKFFDSTQSDCSTNLSSCCVGCPNGSTADSGEIHVSDWHNVPPSFTSPDNGWHVDEGGFGMTTGIMPMGGVATLDIELDILTSNGSLRYEYIAFNTGYGSALYLYFDEELVSSKPLLGRQTSWMLFNLEYGKHAARFIYHASLYQQPTVEGARITYAYEYGTSHMSSVCTTCPTKMYSENSNTCQYCSMNYYADTPGLAACKPCDASTEYAFPGADTCSQRAPCTAADYQARYTECDNNQMIQYYELQLYPICAETETSKPANKTIECTKCNPGTKKENDVCVACPVGEYREKPDDDDSKCIPCPAGTVSFQTSYYKNLFLNATDTVFRTNCQYFSSNIHCLTGGNGWGSDGKSITSGNYYTGPVSAYLTTSISGSYGVTIEFQYRVHLERGSFFSYWEGESGIPTTVNSSENSDEWKKVEISYTGANFTWSFHKRSLGYTSQGTKIADYVEIDYIAFHGLEKATGGAVSCRKCENGSISLPGSTQCTQCPAGFYALAGDSECTACEGNTYSETPGMSECLPCGNGNVAINNHTDCGISTCGVTYDDTNVIDLTPILTQLNADGNVANNDTMCGPVEIGDWPYCSFYLGVCQTQNSRDYCKSGESSIESLFCEISSDAEGGVFSVGNKTNITYFEDTETNEYGVNITYYGGDFFRNDTYASFTGSRAAEVLFVCMPGAGVGKAQKPKTLINHTHKPFITAPHTFHFRWETEYACRLCNVADYQGIQSECVKSTQTTTYVLNPDVKCTGGVAEPKPTSSACTVPVLTMNGGILAVIIVVVLVVAVTIIIILIVLIRSNRKLKYQLFQKENLSTGGVGVGGGGVAAMVSLGKN